MKNQKFALPEIELIATQISRPCALNLRLTQEERDLLDKTAKKFNLSISDLARSILIQSLKHMLNQSNELTVSTNLTDRGE